MNGRQGFTLIELLTVIVLMVILFSIVIFSASGARSSSRDSRRKADLAAISSALEKYRADCGLYPQLSDYNSIPNGGSLTGDGSAPACQSGNVYLREKPFDPEASRRYTYTPNTSRTAYVLCTSLEAAPMPTLPSSDLANCGSCGSSSSCNYLIRNP